MQNELRRLFEAVASGELDPARAAENVRRMAASARFEDLGFARVDHDRARRCGFAEVVLAEGKTPEQVVPIVHAILRHSHVALVTRATETAARALKAEWPGATHDPVSRTVTLGTPPVPDERSGMVLVVSAGTADRPVAEEARITAAVMGCRVEALYDVGVAGLHRLLAAEDRLREAAVIVVVAGMEGALPSVVGGLVRCPVVAVPTSVGYGASFGGVAALLGMLNSCASGVSVVNIDNGFGGGTVAARIALACARRAEP